MTMGKRLALIVVAAAILAGCGTEQTTPSQASSAGEWQSPVMPQPHALWVDGDGVEEVARIAVSLDGDLLLNDQILQKGNFETLDGRRQDDGSVRLVSVDRSSNEAVLLALQDGTPVGTARIVFQGETAKIGRVCVVKSARGTGLGAKLIEACVNVARNQAGIPRAKLGAQTHAIGFYEKLGFEVYGPVYLDAGIDHRDMVKPL